MSPALIALSRLLALFIAAISLPVEGSLTLPITILIFLTFMNV